MSVVVLKEETGRKKLDSKISISFSPLSSDGVKRGGGVKGEKKKNPQKSKGPLKSNQRVRRIQFYVGFSFWTRFTGTESRVCEAPAVAKARTFTV